jgi:transcriptional regulator with XRE-family HTH domain
LDWGRLLRTARQVAGLSLAELSARTALSKGYLSKLEAGAAGAANPSRATLAALARALPSFRLVAHILEPGLDTTGYALAAGIPITSTASGRTSATAAGFRYGAAPQSVDGARVAPPLQLGWRELEVLAALLALEAAALSLPITLPVLARAVGRESVAVAQALERLTVAKVVAMRPPGRVGAPCTYHCADEAATRIGVARVGDLLVLAAALFAGTQARSHETSAPDHDVTPDSLP